MGEKFPHTPLRRRRRSICPISADACETSRAFSPHTLRARGGGRSEYRKVPPGNIERGPTQRDALNHLFGIASFTRRRHEENIRRTPPFNFTTIDDGVIARVRLGVVLKVVTSTGLRLDKLPHPRPAGLEPPAGPLPFTPTPGPPGNGDRSATSTPSRTTSGEPPR